MKEEESSLRVLADLLDEYMKKAEDRGPFEEILQKKEAKSFTELFSKLHDTIQRDIVLTMLYLLPTPPKIRQYVQEQTELNLADFKSMKDVLLYIDAMASSGASQEAKATVCVLGNTSVGKSSLTRTLQDYCNNPTKEPKSCLTGDPKNKEFIETKVLQIVDNVELKASSIPALNIKQEANSSKAFTITSKSTKHDEESDDSNNPESISMTFIDFGGHSPYYSCSPIFLKEKGVYMICFNPEKFFEDKEAYFSSIGTYIEMVTEKCQAPIFILVATKTDECPDNVDYSSILTTAKNHLKSIASRSKSLKQAFIYDEIIKTSSAHVTKDSLDKLVARLVAVCAHKRLLNTRTRNVPNTWQAMFLGLRSLQQVSLEQIERDFMTEQIKRDCKSIYENPERTEAVIGLDGWRAVATRLVDITKQKGPEFRFRAKGICKEPMEFAPNRNQNNDPNEIKPMDSNEEYFALSAEVELILTMYSSFNEIFWFRYEYSITYIGNKCITYLFPEVFSLSATLSSQTR